MELGGASSRRATDKFFDMYMHLSPRNTQATVGTVACRFLGRGDSQYNWLGMSFVFQLKADFPFNVILEAISSL